MVFKMDNIKFNKILFVKNDDIAFQLAVMITLHKPIDRSVQEILFFANQDIVKNKVNYLTYTEMFNELQHYATQWLHDLDIIKDDNDWNFHRSKLLTRCSMLKRIDTPDIITYLINNNQQYVAGVIRSTSIAWNNSIYFVEKDNAYKPSIFSMSFGDNQKLWDVWDILKKYKKGDFESINGEKSHLKELTKILNYRKEHTFFKEQQLYLNPEDLAYIEKMEKDLSNIFFKNSIENNVLKKDDSIINNLKKKLKM